jgi:hypothetical protein
LLTERRRKLPKDGTFLGSGAKDNANLKTSVFRFVPIKKRFPQGIACGLFKKRLVFRRDAMIFGNIGKGSRRKTYQGEPW